MVNMKNIFSKIFKKKNKSNNINHIVEDDILPLQAMYYSINKL